MIRNRPGDITDRDADRLGPGCKFSKRLASNRFLEAINHRFLRPLNCSGGRFPNNACLDPLWDSHRNRRPAVPQANCLQGISAYLRGLNGMIREHAEKRPSNKTIASNEYHPIHDGATSIPSSLGNEPERSNLPMRLIAHFLSFTENKVQLCRQGRSKCSLLWDPKRSSYGIITEYC